MICYWNNCRKPARRVITRVRTNETLFLCDRHLKMTMQLYRWEQMKGKFNNTRGI